MYAALVGVIPEDSLARTMEQTELTPVRKRNPKISRRTAAAIEKALEVHPDDRFQTADEFKQALSLDRSTTIRRLVETGTVPPFGEIERPVQPAEEISEPLEVQEPAPVVDSHPLPIPVSTTLEPSDSQPPVRVKKRRGRGCLWVTGFLVVLSLLLGLIYVYNPAMDVPALNQASTSVSQLLDRMGISTDCKTEVRISYCKRRAPHGLPPGYRR